MRMPTFVKVQTMSAAHLLVRFLNCPNFLSGLGNLTTHVSTFYRHVRGLFKNLFCIIWKRRVWIVDPMLVTAVVAPVDGCW